MSSSSRLAEQLNQLTFNEEDIRELENNLSILDKSIKIKTQK